MIGKLKSFVHKRCGTNRRSHVVSIVQGTTTSEDLGPTENTEDIQAGKEAPRCVCVLQTNTLDA